MKKLGIKSLIFTLGVILLTILPSNSSAEEQEEVFLSSEDEEIFLYENETDETIIATIPNNSIVFLINEENEHYSFIRYIDAAEETLEGYVKNIYISSSSEEVDDETVVEEVIEAENEDHEQEQETETVVEDFDDNIDEEQLKDEEIVVPEEDTEPAEEDETLKKSDKKDNTQAKEKQVIKSRNVSNQKTYRGIALKSTTNIRTKASTKSKVLTTFPVGTVLEYKTYNNNWYEVIININGKKQTGYIHKKHVENAVKSQKTLRGIASNSPTNVRSRASTKASILRSFPIGSVINYQTFSTHWYEISTTVNGKKVVGYIHKKHVENADSNQKNLRGVTKKSPTNVRERASTKSSVKKQYRIGSVIDYKTFSVYWYEVFENGKKIGYIHKNHVENAVANPKSHFGITLKSPTNVRARASTKAEILGTIPVRSIKEYKTFSSHWYEVSFMVNGQKKTGYIHRNHIKNSKNETLRGVANNSTTYIRTNPSTKSNPLTTVPIGTVLEYQVHNLHWYKVSIKGKGIGYVHKKHVENAVMSQKTIRGVALNPKTYIREIASTKSDPVTTHRAGTIFNYKTFSTYWYEVVLGNQVGYVHKKHVENAKANQKADQGVARKSKTIIRTTPSTKSAPVTTYSAGTLIHYKTFNNHWNEVISVNGRSVSGFIHKNHIGNQKVVFIDAGHGGPDSGAVGNGLREKDITLDISKLVRDKLEAAGYTVVMSRTGDTFPSLSDRTNQANSVGADIFVSIHVNAGGGTGIETWMMSSGPESAKSKTLAENIQKEMYDQTKANNRGVKDGNLHVNRESKMPSALVEVGFIDTKSDADKLKQSSYKNKLATGIVNGIKKYFQLIL